MVKKFDSILHLSKRLTAVRISDSRLTDTYNFRSYITFT